MYPHQKRTTNRYFIVFDGLTFFQSLIGDWSRYHWIARKNGLFIDVTLVKRSDAWNMIRMLKWIEHLRYFYRSISFIIYLTARKSKPFAVLLMNRRVINLKKRIFGFLISVWITEKKHIWQIINFDRLFIQHFEI